MKKTLVLLSVVAGIMVPLLAKADPDSVRSGKTVTGKAKAKTVATVPARQTGETIYITHQSVTGSHLPLVVSRYNGHYESMSPLAVYGRPNLDRTGQLSVGGELTQMDPAISSVGASIRR